MKHRPERGLGILLIMGFIGMVIMASCGAETGAGDELADVPVIAEQDGSDEELEGSEDRLDEPAVSDAEQAAAEDLLAGLVGLMILNQLAEEAARQDGAYQDDYDDGGSYDYAGRWGSGSQYSDGSWNHYSEAAGGAVGGTSDGCIYTTFGWSNC